MKREYTIKCSLTQNTFTTLKTAPSQRSRAIEPSVWFSVVNPSTTLKTASPHLTQSVSVVQCGKPDYHTQIGTIATNKACLKVSVVQCGKRIYHTHGALLRFKPHHKEPLECGLHRSRRLATLYRLRGLLETAGKKMNKKTHTHNHTQPPTHTTTQKTKNKK